LEEWNNGILGYRPFIYCFLLSASCILAAKFVISGEFITPLEILEPLMKTTSRTLIYLIIFAIIDTIIPIPLTALLLIYVLTEKPEWFKSLVSRIYNG
jgi:hypothetical protein